MSKKIIVLSGKKGVGKDTVSDLIDSIILDNCQKKSIPIYQIPIFLKYPLARPIKEIVSNFTSISIQNLDKNKETKLEGYNNSPRDFYRKVGDFIADVFGQKSIVNYTINEIKNDIDECSDRVNFIITDMRFDFEFEELKKLENVTFIRIKRNVEKDNSHYSETSLDNVPDSEFDFVIENNKDILSLRYEVKKILKELKIITDE